MFSAPVSLGNVEADGNGIVTYPFTVPASAPAGAHRLVFTSGGVSVTYHFTVTSSSVTTTAAVSPTATRSNPVANTGVDSKRGLLLGIIAISVGAALLLTGLRPRRAKHLMR